MSKCNLDLYSKNQKIQFYIFFVTWEKMRSPDRATFKILKISLNWEKLGITVQDLIYNLWLDCEKLHLNLSFTVENKIGNLHNLRLLTFKT